MDNIKKDGDNVPKKKLSLSQLSKIMTNNPITISVNVAIFIVILVIINSFIVPLVGKIRYDLNVSDITAIMSVVVNSLTVIVLTLGFLGAVFQLRQNANEQRERKNWNGIISILHILDEMNKSTNIKIARDLLFWHVSVLVKLDDENKDKKYKYYKPIDDKEYTNGYETALALSEHGKDTVWYDLYGNNNEIIWYTNQQAHIRECFNHLITCITQIACIMKRNNLVLDDVPIVKIWTEYFKVDTENEEYKNYPTSSLAGIKRRRFIPAMLCY